MKKLNVPVDATRSLIAALMHHLTSHPVLCRQVAKRVQHVDSPSHRIRALAVLNCIRAAMPALPSHFRASRPVWLHELLDVPQADAVQKIMAADGGSVPPPQAVEQAAPPLCRHKQ